MLTSYLGFAAGLALAAAGGELFVRGILAFSAWSRVPAGIAAATLAAFATSAPEFAVSTISAIEGMPQIGLGDALGSNIVNIGLVFGLALVVAPMQLNPARAGRDMAFALAAPLVTLALAADGMLSAMDAMLLLAAFAAWLSLSVREALVHRRASAPAAASQVPHGRAMALGVVALVLLVGAGHLIVQSAGAIARGWGIDAFLVGATVVAVGTSVPEIATTLAARARGRDDVGLGTLLGSNLFNGLCVVGVAASIQPIALQFAEVAATLGCGMLLVAAIVPGRSGNLTRTRGAMLLAAYAGYVALLYSGWAAAPVQR